jgi:hypothetical protein
MMMQKGDHAPHPVPMEVMSTALWRFIDIELTPMEVVSTACFAALGLYDT